jgi:hypothetical protein
MIKTKEEYDTYMEAVDAVCIECPFTAEVCNKCPVQLNVYKIEERLNTAK